MKKTPKNKQQLQASQKKRNTDEQLTFLEHVYELRSRLFWIVATLLVASAAGFQLKDILVSFIMAPLHGEKLVYLTPGGGFSFIFTLCLYFGALVTIPVVVYHLYRFLQPVMGRTSRKLLAGFITLSVSLAFFGAAFGYIVAIPAAINFLTGFAGDAVAANLTAESYLSFVMAYMFGLAALFQLPLIIFMVDHIRKFPPGTLLSTQRFVIVGSVIAAAIVTPTPDVVNQMIIAGPIVVVYQLGVLAVWVRRRGDIPVKPMETRVVSRSEELISREPLSVTVPVSEKSVVSPTVTRPGFQRRSIDGLMRSSSPVAVPARDTPGTVSRLTPVSTTRPRRLRSIDGLSIV